MVNHTFILAICLLFSLSSGFLHPSARSMPFVSTTALAASDGVAEVKVGDKIPEVTMTEGQADYGKPEQVNLAELIAGKTVAIFAVPGAFTPGCSKSHLPSFITAKDDLKAKGVDMIICVATNDAYVMEAWGRTSGGADAGIRFLSDGTGELTKKLGMAIDNPVFMRSKRYSLIAKDGVVTHFFSADEESSNTWAPNVLAAL
jgi:peroxiredoxin